jgi:3-oxoacyl-(acyl-carrier-protein) synthase
MRDGIVHPTINLEEADPACYLDYVPGRARATDVALALVNACALGGHCVTLALQGPRPG